MASKPAYYAQAFDVLPIMQLVGEMATDSTVMRGLPNFKHMRAQVEGFIQNPAAAVLVVEVEGRIIGLCIAIMCPDIISGELGAAQVCLYVSKGHRGHVGEVLVREMLGWAKRCGASWVQMSAPNPAYVRWFRRLGFRPVEQTVEVRL